MSYRGATSPGRKPRRSRGGRPSAKARREPSRNLSRRHRLRTRSVLSSLLASGLIIFVGAEIGTQIHTGAVAPATAGSANPAPSSSPTPADLKLAAPTQYHGALEQTKYGSVQVSVTVAAGKVTDVTALKLTDQGGRSVQISAYAAPILRSEVIASQSAKVNSVSGATYTSDGYLSSVQSALDSAHLG